MFITENSVEDYFDWDCFFSEENTNIEMNADQLSLIVSHIRKHLAENSLKFAVQFNKVMKKALEDININQPNTLELGAATGFLTRWLLQSYGGHGILLDKNMAAYKRYCDIKDPIKNSIEYCIQDVFRYETEKRFDIVCSFGLIEHFVEKNEVMEAHKKFLKKGGYAIILAPMDTPLTRTFYEVFPELNRGYRELLTAKELRKIMESAGFNIVRIVESSHYCYDYVMAVASIN